MLTMWRFRRDIDVQTGNGRLNYINGHVSKDHDAVDVGLGEHVQKGATAPWLAAYRLVSKGSPGRAVASLPNGRPTWIGKTRLP